MVLDVVGKHQKSPATVRNRSAGDRLLGQFMQANSCTRYTTPPSTRSQGGLSCVLVYYDWLIEDNLGMGSVPGDLGHVSRIRGAFGGNGARYERDVNQDMGGVGIGRKAGTGSVPADTN